MSYKYDNLDELRRKKELLKSEVKDLEKLISFKNPKESLSAITHGYTDQFIKEVEDQNGETSYALDSSPIVRGISNQLKSTMNKNTMMQMAQSEPGSDLIKNAVKLGAVTFVANYAQKNMKASSWKKKLIGLALIYVAPIALKYAREKLEEYSRNKTASSLEKLI